MTFKTLRRLSAYAGLLFLYLISSSARAQIDFPPVFYGIPSSSQLPASCAGAIGWVIASPGTGSGSVYTCQAGAPALVSGGGGGSGTVTSVTFAGTANQITATGTCTGTTVINCTLSIPTAFQLPGTIDGLTITTTTGTFTLANAKTLTVSNTMTFTAADSSTVAFGTGGTVLYTTSSAGSFPTLNQSTTGNAATATNLATYPALCSGGQFSEGYTTGSPPTNNCATPSGGGNVGTSGTPAQYEAAAWAGSTTIEGIGPGAANAPFLGGGASAYPAFSTILYPTSLSSGGVVCGTSTTQLASSASLTVNVLPKGGGAGACPANSLFTDDGTTATYSGTGGIVASSGPISSTSDGTHAGQMSIVGNTTTPSIASNSFGFIGPNSASFTSYVFQPVATAPSAIGPMLVGAVSSNISTVSYGTVSGTGTVFCLTVSCAMTTPNIGTPSAGVMTNMTGTPASIGLANGTGLPVSTGISGLGSNVNTFLATPSGSNFNAMIAAGGIPVNCNGTCAKSADYTTVLGDGGGLIIHAIGDNNARTFTIDSNANVAFPLYTVLTFINSINTVTIAITSDTLTLAGTASTGSRTLAANGVATAVKVGTTSWIISGPGLT